jgi:anti-anti-sigma factor
MQISVSSHEHIPVLCIEGDLDMASAPEFETAVGEHSNAYRSSLILDLSRCTFIDSGGLNVLLQTIRQLDDLAWLGVAGANDNLCRVFEIVGLMAIPSFRVLDDLRTFSG